MQRCDCPDVSPAVVGDDPQVVFFRYRADLSKARDPFHDQRFGLQDVIHSFLGHLAKLVKSSVVFASCNRYGHVAVQFRDLREVVTRQGLF